jgi:hypothetical protein
LEPHEKITWVENVGTQCNQQDNLQQLILLYMKVGVVSARPAWPRRLVSLIRPIVKPTTTIE